MTPCLSANGFSCPDHVTGNCCSESVFLFWRNFLPGHTQQQQCSVTIAACTNSCIMVLQNFFLVSRHLQQLKKEYGVEPWQFEQHQGEGVFIPAGCPHQVPCSTHLSSQVYLSHNMTKGGGLHPCWLPPSGTMLYSPIISDIPWSQHDSTRGKVFAHL